MNVNTFFDSRSKIIRHAYNAVGRDICLDMLFKKKHNYLNNPDLESIVNDGEYDVYWDVVAKAPGTDISIREVDHDS